MSRHSYSWAVASLWLIYAAAMPTPTRADVVGLVIGIDDYGGADDLHGAVADAQDVAAALRRIGARDVVVLLNTEARRARIFSELQSMEKKTKAGDIIVLHYAGHGAQEPIRPGDTDADGDGRNEDFVLGGFRILHDPGERVIDKEVIAWLADTGKRGVKVLFVADSCHSGGMIRGMRPGVRTRKLEIAPPGLDSIARNVRSISMADPGLANVTFLAAVPRNRASPEITIDGKPRGALSWAFARALEGAATPAGAPELTRSQLQRFVVPTVIALSEGQQLPQMFPPRADDGVLLPLAGTKAAPISAAQGQIQGSRELGAVRAIKLAVTGGPVSTIPPPNAQFVGVNEAPDLVWDVKARTVSQRIGGVVAENVETYDIDMIVAKWAALDLIKHAMAATAPDMELVTGLKTYGRGEEVRIRISGARQPYLTIFNLPPNGRVELLYPDSNKATEVNADWRGRPVDQNFFVDRPPFGAEHLVAIFSSEPLKPLHAALARMADRNQAIHLPDILRESLAGPGIQAGVMPIYTNGK